jgi:hypothetical protein
MQETDCGAGVGNWYGGIAEIHGGQLVLHSRVLKIRSSSSFVSHSFECVQEA